MQSTKQDTLQRYHDNLKREFEQQRLDYQNQPSAEHKLALENTQSLLVNIERQINALKRLSGDERACSPPLSLISRVSCPIPHSNNTAALSILRSTYPLILPTSRLFLVFSGEHFFPSQRCRLKPSIVTSATPPQPRLPSLERPTVPLLQQPSLEQLLGRTCRRPPAEDPGGGRRLDHAAIERLLTSQRRLAQTPFLRECASPSRPSPYFYM